MSHERKAYGRLPARARMSGIASVVIAGAMLAPATAEADATQQPPPADAGGAAPTPPPAPPAVTIANKGSLTIKGFINATLFAQDTPFTFGDGQNAQMPLPTRDKGDDPWFFDGDVRNTRLNLTWAGPTGTALPPLGAVLEVDFFAPAGGGGAFGNAQAVPRIRLAFADLGIGRNTLRVGQDWSPWFGNVPVSLAHQAFPLGFGSAASGGWRFPGVFFAAPLTPTDAALAAKLTVGVMRNAWPAVANLNPPNQGSTGLPQVEARLDVSGKAGTAGWSAYAVGHYDRKDLSGRGDAPTAGDDKLDAYGAEVGAKLTAGPLLVQANGYVGRAMGHQFMNLAQFGDILSVGAWAQAGYDLTPSWSVFLFYGLDDPDDDDVIAAVPVAPDTAAGSLPRLRNMQAVAMLRFKVGPYQMALEYLWDRLKFRDPSGNGNLTGNQIALSANYTL